VNRQGERVMVASRHSAGEVPAVTVGGHFERVAAVYESLRTTDEAPVRRIGRLLPDRPVTGLDIGFGTGRYSRLLRALLPEGSRLAVSDVSAAMLAQLKAASHGQARGVVPLPAAAEESSGDAVSSQSTTWRDHLVIASL
jgi:ubiquinone/menaquinone biosynthesis C-methylase UbiE